MAFGKDSYDPQRGFLEQATAILDEEGVMLPPTDAKRELIVLSPERMLEAAKMLVEAAREIPLSHIVKN